MSSEWTSRYSFAEFVVGSCNEAAYTAASAAVISPGALYNPILITGATGSGKSHLAYAIVGEAMLRAERSVLFLSADRFLRRISIATQRGTVADTVHALATVGTLVIDDAHIVSRHAAAHEALTNLAGLAVTLGSQLVLTGDTTPEADSRSERLVRQLRSAHIATLGAPDWSHRVAILHSKARAQNVALPPVIAHHIAAQCSGSTRELEGLLNRVLAVAALEAAPLSMSLALRALPIHPRAGVEMVGAQVVQEAVAAEWGVPPEALIGSGRARRLTQPRRLAMLLCRDVLDLSLREIGAAFGDRDVSTVFSAISRARDELEAETAVTERVFRVRTELPMSGATAPSPR
jgi:chromosomal replication initiator protein